jgi:hypothetical protein
MNTRHKGLSYEDFRGVTFPEAVRLVRRQLDNERYWIAYDHSTDPPTPSPDGMKTLEDHDGALNSAMAIWATEMQAAQRHIAERIRAELPDIAHHLADCIEADDYTDMMI